MLTPEEVRAALPSQLIDDLVVPTIQHTLKQLNNFTDFTGAPMGIKGEPARGSSVNESLKNILAKSYNPVSSSAEALFHSRDSNPFFLIVPNKFMIRFVKCDETGKYSRTLTNAETRRRCQQSPELISGYHYPVVTIGYHYEDSPFGLLNLFCFLQDGIESRAWMITLWTRSNTSDGELSFDLLPITPIVPEIGGVITTRKTSEDSENTGT